MNTATGNENNQLKSAASDEVAISMTKVNKWFGNFHVLKNISLGVNQGERIVICGPSGSGKTTLGLALLRLISSRGHIKFKKKSIQELKFKQLQPLRRQMQIIFQDPFGSLNPRMSVGEIVAEGLQIHKIETDKSKREQLIIDILTQVGLEAETKDRYPCLLYTSPSPRDRTRSRMPSSA